MSDINQVEQNAYHKFMAALSAHPKTTVILTAAVAFVFGFLL